MRDITTELGITLVTEEASTRDITTEEEDAGGGGFTTPLGGLHLRRLESPLQGLTQL